ncbi:hypothetical protein O181_019853 [Austropuccinia psidii MF-1]|uniref:Reverse transcriptase Ty1/copia-type domain-containing protein n=1 Tax=Austropuccinia psidii MF-1 TaxID=1389203 RepID=A0A9Q3CAE0_9BASI|nr:hypothetical protein [Austropuccinia psidii MF-1]
MTNLNVWEEVGVKEDFKLIGTTWVFKTKRNEFNQIVEHKACLCAQGFSQTQGKDYSKTNLKFEQLDIKSAFLNAPLEENVYLTIPQGLDRDKKNTCLKLKRAIYGLKQAPLAWYRRLSSWLVDFSFSISKADSCVFYLKSNDPIWLFLHVDDIGIFGRNLANFKKAIEREFQTKLLGSADLMLGIKIIHQPDTITLTQSHYIDSLLESYGMSNCKHTTTPLIPNMHFEAASRTFQEEFASLKLNYRSAVGSLSYLSTATRPDLSYSVSALSQFLENPGIQHWKAFLHVLKYLKGTSEIGLVYRKNTSKLPVAYSDADWGNCRVTRRSTTGYLILFNNNLVIWKTRKQPTVSLSSAEAEYRSLTDLASKLLWFKQFIEEINILTMTKAILVHEDNQGCINTANSDCNTNTRRMKHIDIQLHFIRDVIGNKIIELIYTPTANMLADFLTKSVSRPAIKRAMKELQLLTTGDKGGVEICDLSQSYSRCHLIHIIGLFSRFFWSEKLTGFTPCTLDPCVFHRSALSPIWLYVHVDDIAIFGKEVETFKSEISSEFDIKDLGKAELLLEVKVTQYEDRTTLDQQHHAEALLELYGMGDCRPVSTHLVPNQHLS